MVLELPLLMLVSEGISLSEIEKWDWEFFQKVLSYKQFKNEIESILLDIDDTKGNSDSQVIELSPLPKEG